MKKAEYLMVVIFMVLSFVGCAKQQLVETEMTPDEISSAIMESQSELPSLKQIGSEDEDFRLWLSDYYLIEAEKIVDGAICCADGAEACEIAVLEIKDEKDSKTVETAWEEYRKNRENVFEGYAPQQAAMVENGSIVVKGKYAALLICQDTSAAEAAFFDCFEKKAGDSKKQDEDKRVSAPNSDAVKKETSEETENFYDSTAVLEAWKSGDDSQLSESDLRILNAAKDTIQQQIKDTMSDYEKELTIHDWITDWSSFDYGIFDRSDDGFTEGSDTPYGVLIDREAMCHGYSSTFQLFMDMLDIECITVFGTPDGDGVQHSWNMVKLDGDWYCVDTAWDDPIGGNPGHSYFNVTSEYLREGSIHRWDAASVPEATVALHYVFDSPKDKILFDVSHQCYTHKLLTGRKAAYLNPAQYMSVSGFTNPAESEHDMFSVGHTSTAISLACGVAKARDLRGETSNVIALVGDGALSGGEALEGLNNASALESNIIIIVNDNDMSIAENHGGLYQNLKLLRDTEGKAGCNFFRALGFSYFFVHNGNSVSEMIDILSKVKNTTHPVVIHMCTVKGKGYHFAESDREIWHYREPFHIDTGKPLHEQESVETYETLTGRYLAAKMKENPDVVAITAGTPKVLGLDAALRKQFPKQIVDVGIAEEHAIAMASGIAKSGGRPVFGVSSSFLQRTYDQLSQDLALNHSPAVILVFFAGISQGSQTHMGVFDIPLAANIPNIIYLAPTCKEEYFRMLEWGLEQTENPVIIRVPGIATTTRKAVLLPSYRQPAKYEIVQAGSDVAIIALGSFFSLGSQIRNC